MPSWSSVATLEVRTLALSSIHLKRQLTSATFRGKAEKLKNGSSMLQKKGKWHLQRLDRS